MRKTILKPAKNNSSRSTIEKRVERDSNRFFAGLRFCAFNMLRKSTKFFHCMFCILMDMYCPLLDQMKDTNNHSSGRYVIRKYYDEAASFCIHGEGDGEYNVGSWFIGVSDEGEVQKVRDSLRVGGDDSDGCLGAGKIDFVV